MIALRGVLKIPTKSGAYVDKAVARVHWKIDDSNQDEEYVRAESPIYSRRGDVIGKFDFCLNQYEQAETPTDRDLVLCWCKQIAGNQPPEVDFVESVDGDAKNGDKGTGIELRLRIRAVGFCEDTAQVNGDIIKWAGAHSDDLKCG